MEQVKVEGHWTNQCLGRNVLYRQKAYLLLTTASHTHTHTLVPRAAGKCEHAWCPVSHARTRTNWSGRNIKVVVASVSVLFFCCRAATKGPTSSSSSRIVCVYPKLLTKWRPMKPGGLKGSLGAAAAATSRRVCGRAAPVCGLKRRGPIGAAFGFGASASGGKKKTFHEIRQV